MSTVSSIVLYLKFVIKVDLMLCYYHNKNILYAQFVIEFSFIKTVKKSQIMLVLETKEKEWRRVLVKIFLILSL